MLDLRSHFSRFLAADPERLHFAAHSHHPWPDVTRDAQLAAWEDANRLADDKWGLILGPVLAEFRGHVARILGLPDPATIAVAPNTHEFLRRLLSCFPPSGPVRILTSDGEFHSFTRQIARLEEAELVSVTRVPVDPAGSFVERFLESAETDFDLVFVSEVFFNSGFALDLAPLAAIRPEALLVIDGYHGFMARPNGFAALADRAFYMAGGYKYAMAGEGACFMHCPPGLAPRPRDTGWFAAFGDLAKAPGGGVPYPSDGWRFMGATFDPSGLYRFNAVMRWLSDLGLAVETIHAHAHALQRRFVEHLPPGCGLVENDLVVPLEELRRGNFLTFDTLRARELHEALHARKMITDVRGTRLRFGFGVYQTGGDVDRLIERVS